MKTFIRSYYSECDKRPIFPLPIICIFPFFVDSIDQVSSPTLIIHGDQDEFIGFDQGQRVRAAILISQAFFLCMFLFFFWWVGGGGILINTNTSSWYSGHDLVSVCLHMTLLSAFFISSAI